MTTRVTIASDGDSYRSLDAEVYGEWAAHLATPDPGWTVTYLPSGRNIRQDLRGSILTASQAMEIADRLDIAIDRAKETILDCISRVLDKVAA